MYQTILTPAYVCAVLLLWRCAVVNCIGEISFRQGNSFNIAFETFKSVKLFPRSYQSLVFCNSVP